MERTTVYQDQPTRGRMNFMKGIAWSAVFAGVLVAVVTQLLLSLLGLGIGLGTVYPVEEQHPTAGLGTGSAIWYIISSLLSLFPGGWIAGRLASAPVGSTASFTASGPYPSMRQFATAGSELGAVGPFPQFIDCYPRG